ncbi:MAG: hypothetical protein WD069_18055 [Planctomycetales bacterium]
MSDDKHADKHADPVIDEIRAIRHEISARFGHDPKKLVEYYIELQRRHADRLVSMPGAARKRDEPAA